jgi:ABC-type phosphate transport system permease subunit
MTQAGYVCGIIGTVFFAIGMVVACMYFGLLAAIIGGGR